MKLYLVQHGLAKSKTEDPERPLTDQGLAETMKMAEFATSSGIVQPNHIFHSGKTRAKQTAEVLAEQLKLALPEKVLPSSGLAPMDETAIWADKLGQMTEEVMLVGHLPHLAKLSARLLVEDENKNIVKFRNSGIVCLDRDDDGVWSLSWLAVPEMRLK